MTNRLHQYRNRLKCARLLQCVNLLYEDSKIPALNQALFTCFFIFSRRLTKCVVVAVNFYSKQCDVSR